MVMEQKIELGADFSFRNKIQISFYPRIIAVREMRY